MWMTMMMTLFATSVAMRMWGDDNSKQCCLSPKKEEGRHKPQQRHSAFLRKTTQKFQIEEAVTEKFRNGLFFAFALAARHVPLVLRHSPYTRQPQHTYTLFIEHTLSSPPRCRHKSQLTHTHYIYRPSGIYIRAAPQASTYILPAKPKRPPKSRHLCEQQLKDKPKSVKMHFFEKRCRNICKLHLFELHLQCSIKVVHYNSRKTRLHPTPSKPSRSKGKRQTRHQGTPKRTRTL